MLCTERWSKWKKLHFGRWFLHLAYVSLSARRRTRFTPPQASISTIWFQYQWSHSCKTCKSTSTFSECISFRRNIICNITAAKLVVAGSKYKRSEVLRRPFHKKKCVFEPESGEVTVYFSEISSEKNVKLLRPTVKHANVWLHCLNWLKQTSGPGV